MKEFQISGPRAPRPSDADLASFGSLQKWDAEVYGYQRPESEFRQTWDSDSSGRPRKERDFPGAQSFMAMMTSTNRFTKIPYPCWRSSQVPTLQRTGSPRAQIPQCGEAASAYYTAIMLRRKGRRERSKLACPPRVWSG